MMSWKYRHKVLIQHTHVRMMHHAHTQTHTHTRARAHTHLLFSSVHLVHMDVGQDPDDVPWSLSNG